jgi:hypothetical protein
MFNDQELNLRAIRRARGVVESRADHSGDRASCPTTVLSLEARG